MKLLHLKSNAYFIKQFYRICFSLLFLFSLSIEGKTGIGYTENDSTIQEVIEFTHTKKGKKDFFKKGDEVVIYSKNKSVVTKGTIDGFTKDGILIDGKEIPIDEINLIRGKSVLAFIFSIFSGASLVGGIVLIVPIILGIGLFFILLENADSLVDIIAIFFLGIIVLAVILSLLFAFLSLAIIFAIASSISKRVNKSYSLRKKWMAKIVSKKLSVEKKTKK